MNVHNLVHIHIPIIALHIYGTMWGDIFIDLNRTYIHIYTNMNNFARLKNYN